MDDSDFDIANLEFDNLGPSPVSVSREHFSSGSQEDTLIEVSSDDEDAYVGTPSVLL
jgi:hypothetical protein